MISGLLVAAPTGIGTTNSGGADVDGDGLDDITGTQTTVGLVQPIFS